MKLGDLSDAQLLENLKSLCGQGRVVLARLLAHLIEVEQRRLHLEAACPSLYQFCVRALGMSEDEACRRIQAARLARRFPDLLARLERGPATSRSSWSAPWTCCSRSSRSSASARPRGPDRSNSRSRRPGRARGCREPRAARSSSGTAS